MPLYEYECDACGRRFELIQRFADPPQETCISCGSGPVHKLISSSAIQFKGTGWYVTDYAAKDKASSSGDADKTSGDPDKKPAAPSGEPAKSSPSSDSSSSSSSDTSTSSATKSS